MIFLKVFLWTYAFSYLIGVGYVLFSISHESDKNHEENVRKNLEDN